MREVTGDKGSLCGMAAMYQAASQTILTMSEMKQMSFDEVKVLMGTLLLDMDEATSKATKDIEFLAEYRTGNFDQMISFWFKMILGIEMCEAPSGRKKRDVVQKQRELPRLSDLRKKRQTETLLDIEMRSYGSQLRYECGLARKFYDPEEEETYDERWMQCNWNNTWTIHDSLDDCIWVQCLYPPEPPPNTLLSLTWLGDPVDFYDNVSYVCQEEDLYFEWDREKPEFNISCLPGGSWDKPVVWPICVACKDSCRLM